MPSASGRMPWWQQLGARAVNMIAPGTPLNTRASSFGSAWRTGDYNRAARGDKYAIGRTAASFLPYGGLLNIGINRLERNAINQREYQPDFVGPPQYRGSRRDQMRRLGITSTATRPDGLIEISPGQFVYADPNSVGPPVEKPDKPSSRGSTSNNGGSSSNLLSNSGRSGSSAGRGHGWQGSNDVAGTLANLQFFSGDFGGGQLTGNPFARYAIQER